jgi:putative phosphoribosyl transferase
MDFVSQTAEPLRRRGVVDEERVIPASDTLLKATLNVPLGPQGVAALLHASSGDRFGVQSRFASEVLGQAGFATLQVDLLTPDEEAALLSSRHPEEHVSLLLSRILAVIDWLGNQHETSKLSVGLFASTMEIIPALLAAERDSRVKAVASRGGCPDFAQDAVGELRAPTLLIVGRDEQARAAELASEFFARRLVSRIARDELCSARLGSPTR